MQAHEMQDKSGCPLCGIMTNGDREMLGRTSHDTQIIRGQIDNLERRLDDLDEGRTTAERVRAQRSMLCPMCQGMMGDLSESPDRDELKAGIERHIGRLEDRIRGLERRTA